MARYDGNSFAWMVEEQLEMFNRSICSCCGRPHAGIGDTCKHCIDVEDRLDQDWLDRQEG